MDAEFDEYECPDDAPASPLWRGFVVAAGWLAGQLWVDTLELIACAAGWLGLLARPR